MLEAKKGGEHIATHLRLAARVLRRVQPEAWFEFDPWIRLSIVSVGGLLTRATKEAYEADSFDKND